jgi:ribosomal protein L16 Arg81 hydroxylase
VTPEVFAAEYWGRKPLLCRAADLGEDFGDLFSLEAVDELVADRAIRTPFVRMANEGDLLAPGRYTGPSGFGAEVPDQLDADKVLEEFAGGATLVLQGLHRTWAPLRDFTRTLIEELGHPAQVNAYVTPASSRGFDPHYDVHDVFVIQIYGEKHWVIHPPVHEDPLSDQPWSDRATDVAAGAQGTPAIDATFAPGDVLYLPRGWIHSATALGGTSIHLTIGVAALTRWDIVGELVAGLKNDPALRASLPVGLGDVEAAVADAVEAITASLRESADAASVARALDRKVQASTRPEPVRPISTVERLGSLERVRWRKGWGASLERTDAEIRIVGHAKTVSLPLEAAAAVEALVTGAPYDASALPGLDRDSSLVVARRLVREGILVLA